MRWRHRQERPRSLRRFRRHRTNGPFRWPCSPPRRRSPARRSISRSRPYYRISSRDSGTCQLVGCSLRSDTEYLRCTPFGRRGSARRSTLLGSARRTPRKTGPRRTRRCRGRNSTRARAVATWGTRRRPRRPPREGARGPQVPAHRGPRWEGTRWPRRRGGWQARPAAGRRAPTRVGWRRSSNPWRGEQVKTKRKTSVLAQSCFRGDGWRQGARNRCVSAYDARPRSAIHGDLASADVQFRRLS